MQLFRWKSNETDLLNKNGLDKIKQTNAKDIVSSRDVRKRIGTMLTNTFMEIIPNEWPKCLHHFVLRILQRYNSVKVVFTPTRIEESRNHAFWFYKPNCDEEIIREFEMMHENKSQPPFRKEVYKKLISRTIMRQPTSVLYQIWHVGGTLFVDNSEEDDDDEEDDIDDDLFDALLARKYNGRNDFCT